MKIGFLVSFLVIVVQVHAQNEKEGVFKFSNYGQKKIILAEPFLNTSPINLFNKVIIKDARYDTSVIGFSDKNQFSINNTGNVIERYFNHSLGLEKLPDTGNQLIIYIEKIWVTNKLVRTVNGWNGGMCWKIECFYINNGSYFPAFRFDTSFAANVYNIIKDAPKLIDTCLKQTIQKIISWQNSDSHFSNTKMSLQDVNSYIESRFNLHILADNVLNKGVYVTFLDFKENNPRYFNYELNKGKLTEALYIKDINGQDQLLRNIWGYCDGKNVFIKSAENYYQLYKSGRTFYTRGAKGISKNIGRDLMRSGLIDLANPITEDSPKKTVAYFISYYPYQLDMESGEIF